MTHESVRISRADAAVGRCVDCRYASGPIARTTPPARCQSVASPHYARECRTVTFCANWEPR